MWKCEAIPLNTSPSEILTRLILSLVIVPLQDFSQISTHPAYSIYCSRKFPFYRERQRTKKKKGGRWGREFFTLLRIHLKSTDRRRRRGNGGDVRDTAQLCSQNCETKGGLQGWSGWKYVRGYRKKRGELEDG